MARPALILLSLLLAACSGGGNSGKEEPPQRRDLRVEQIFSGAPGQGPERPRIILARSASALSKGLGKEVPNSGEGTYLTACWGEKPTGGYSLAVESARLERDRVTVRITLEEPPPDAMVTQALTYPYAVAVVHHAGLPEKGFVFVGQDGSVLDWPVRRVGG